MRAAKGLSDGIPGQAFQMEYSTEKEKSSVADRFRRVLVLPVGLEKKLNWLDAADPFIGTDNQNVDRE